MILSNPKEDARSKIIDAELFIKSKLKNPTILHSFQSHSSVDFIVMNSLLLNSIDAVYCVGEWGSSSAVTGFLDCLRAENKPMYVANVGEWHLLEQFISRLASSIESVSSISLGDLFSSSRDREKYFARLIFWHLSIKEGISKEIIGRILKRSKMELSYYEKQFYSEVQFNKEFASFYQRVIFSMNTVIPYRFKSFKQCRSMIVQFQGSRELGVSQ